MKRFPEDNNLLIEYNELCEKGFNVKNHAGLTFHHILPRCTHPECKDDPENWTWLSFEDHWTAHYLLWKATRLPVYAAAFWFACVYGIKYRNMRMDAHEYDELKHDVGLHNAAKRKEKARERYERFKEKRAS